ncbi:WXG100 family type VII secretion target [Saccharothrix coeruleofusca]|uniref:Uncharacterized protein n=1 Tax=Saccharothrix coeruleofusca TaxID=33919 RepID=A0A918APH0_9PSEU|nr:hypothetical protein [Saccharothrix coeruleofusca]MBP2339408.1 hypothetical protein [Saccharothrix coeruleofusca]GGP57901.1 hypothetical protein GCM10010185_32890 [Saccharothrix coeruleofusca]
MTEEKTVSTEQEVRDDNYWTSEDGGDGFLKGEGFVGTLQESGLYESGQKAWSALGDLTSGNPAEVHAAVGEIQGFVAELPIAGLVVDPLHTLLTFGLGFLVDLIKPLDDALKLVTGDEEQLGIAAEKFDKVSKDLEGLAKKFATTVETGLESWQGAASGASRERLAEFAEGIMGTSGEAAGVVDILNGSKALMKTAYDLVMDLIASLVEWLIITWLAAQAAAVPTLGASEVAAAAATTAEIAVATSRVTRIVQKVTAILQKISKALKVLSGRLAGPKWWRTTAEKFAGKDAMDVFRGRDAAGNVLGPGGWKGSAQQFGRDALTNAGTTLVDNAKAGGKDVYDMLADEPPNAADVDRKLSI